uniref:Uncharacterized protein n=1 Tax=Anguilla anguilla TaxID=7936 RepID=A0A0E9R567_ANGAN
MSIPIVHGMCIIFLAKESLGFFKNILLSFNYVFKICSIDGQRPEAKYTKCIGDTEEPNTHGECLLQRR